MPSAPRFFIDGARRSEETLALPPEAAHHARAVLRLREGDAVTLHDGAGNAAAGRIVALSSREARVATGPWTPVATEPATRITIAQALPRTAEKLEQVLQHGTEIGAAAFLVFAAARSVARLDTGEKRARRLARWRAIVRSAAEQSGRGLLPPVDWTDDTEALGRRDGEPRLLLLHEAASTPLRTALRPVAAGRLLLAVGPEGGFTDDEVEALARAGATPVSLGPRLLRTETAALVALAQILYERGE